MPAKGNGTAHSQLECTEYANV
ncbi:Uncharacterized protein APZ42_014811 [Daphnia magna]|uniref:Uncharacterized protein n=1 Tax=Daphnia magna TaxID=35525 RepID=A0A162PK38_9CRUS|nr:Uncharacterized protein APZ42_014811 [Daphnia magna]